MAEGSELIDRKLLFGNPDVVGVSLSPDGRQMSYLAPFDGVLNVWVAPDNDLAKKRVVTQDKKRGVRNHSWAYTSRHILYLQDKDGDENWHIYAVDLNSGESRDLTPFPNVQAQIEKGNKDRPLELVIGLNQRDARFHDLFLLNIASGEMKMIEENKEGYAGYLVDNDFNVRFASRYESNGSISLFKKNAQGVFESFMSIPAEDTMTTGPVTLSKDGTKLVFRESRGRDTGALTEIDLRTNAQKVLAEDPLSDASDIMFHPTEKTIEAVGFYYERKRWEFLDRFVEGDFRFLQSLGKGDLEVTSRSLADDLWIVAFYRDNGPVSYELFDRKNKDLKFLFTSRRALENLKLAKMHPTVIEARDGLKLVSYLSLPASVEGDRPNEPLPMVLFVHGGPWTRDAWGFNPYHQLLANRGYAVLSVNYRGSTGFGKKFVNAGNLEWAGKMHDDLVDAVKWAVDQGVADLRRVAIMGGSYGGYATLVGLTFTPDLFACGVDIVGPSNLNTLLNSIPPYWEAARQSFKDRMGNPDTPEGKKLLEERSPLNYVEKICKPLLIAQGANDPRVKQAESDQIVKTMKEKKIPVTYVLYPDEGHGFARPENSLSFMAITEAFLSRCMGGEFQPIENELKNSTAQILEGRNGVPGL
jgi:dipeptidyl aminopeptidase/acylaminoacyl peptidase